MLNPSCPNANRSILEAEFSMEELIKTESNSSVSADDRMDEFSELPLDEVDEALDETLSVSLPFTKIALTSLTSLIATCGIGFFMTDKAPGNEVVNVPAVPPDTTFNLLAQRSSAQVPLQATPDPAAPTMGAVEFSSRQETQALVQDALTEYHALLDRGPYTPPPSPVPLSVAPSSEMSAPTPAVPTMPAVEVAAEISTPPVAEDRLTKTSNRFYTSVASVPTISRPSSVQPSVQQNPMPPTSISVPFFSKEWHPDLSKGKDTELDANLKQSSHDRTINAGSEKRSAGK
ncbi:MAG: hypothetical protein Kow00121_65040 [Elainellaceae cyanobacterium]